MDEMSRRNEKRRWSWNELVLLRPTAINRIEWVISGRRRKGELDKGTTGSRQHHLSWRITPPVTDERYEQEERTRDSCPSGATRGMEEPNYVSQIVKNAQQANK